MLVKTRVRGGEKMLTDEDLGNSADCTGKEVLCRLETAALRDINEILLCAHPACVARVRASWFVIICG